MYTDLERKLTQNRDSSVRLANSLLDEIVADPAPKCVDALYRLIDQLTSSISVGAQLRVDLEKVVEAGGPYTRIVEVKGDYRVVPPGDPLPDSCDRVGALYL